MSHPLLPLPPPLPSPFLLPRSLSRARVGASGKDVPMSAAHLLLVPLSKPLPSLKKAPAFLRGRRYRELPSPGPSGHPSPLQCCARGALVPHHPDMQSRPSVHLPCCPSLNPLRRRLAQDEEMFRPRARFKASYEKDVGKGRPVLGAALAIEQLMGEVGAFS